MRITCFIWDNESKVIEAAGDSCIFCGTFVVMVSDKAFWSVKKAESLVTGGIQPFLKGE
jgi:hypothetical protein